ncbi:RNA-directed DNA polymerase, eukaryota [Tanacetum coccineum]
MAIGTNHRSNNYSESKRNDHLDNNCRQEQRNKGIPNKSHPNFREEHKSFSSIFVSNIPWNASVQDLWDIVSNGCGDQCLHSYKEIKWVIDLSIYRMLSGHWASNSGHVRANTVPSNAGAESVGRSILAKVKDLSVISELLKHMSSEGFDDVGLRYVGGRWVWLEFDSMDQVERMKMCLDRTGGSAIGIHGAPEARFVMIRSCIMMGVSKGLHERFEDEAGEILWSFILRMIVINVTTDDNEDVTPVIVPGKRSSLRLHIHPSGNDLNIVQSLVLGGLIILLP